MLISCEISSCRPEPGKQSLLASAICFNFYWKHNLLFFSLCKTSKKTTFSVFLSFFSRKIVQISIFKVEYLENGLADFNDFGLISFCRILNGLSNEINLLYHCSSPLKLYSSVFL